MQLFRFAATVVLLVVISLAGIAQEKQRLMLTRAISLQQYRIDQLLERRAHLQLRMHELNSPVRRAPDQEVTRPDSRAAAAESRGPVR